MSDMNQKKAQTLVIQLEYPATDEIRIILKVQTVVYNHFFNILMKFSYFRMRSVALAFFKAVTLNHHAFI